MGARALLGVEAGIFCESSHDEKKPLYTVLALIGICANFAFCLTAVCYLWSYMTYRRMCNKDKVVLGTYYERVWSVTMLALMTYLFCSYCLTLVPGMGIKGDLRLDDSKGAYTWRLLDGVRAILALVGMM